MKRILAFLSVCLLIIMTPVYAADAYKLEAEVTGTRLLHEWDGQTSDENDWFVVDLKLTNWHVDAQNISDLLSGKLVFQRAYSFDGVPVFDTDTIYPLVEKTGSILFKIPKMISRMFSPRDVKVFITVDGDEREVETEVKNNPEQRTGTFEGSGYDSPEEAVVAYLSGLNNGNVTQMLSTFAMESFIEHADPEDFLRRMRVFSLSSTNAVPRFSEYAKSAALNARYGDYARTLLMQYIELSANTEGTMLQMNDEDSVRDLLDKFSSSPANAWNGKVEFVEWLDPGSITSHFYTAQNLLNVAITMACAGAEDYAELAAHIKLNGVDAVQFMECIKYGDRWYNLNYQSNLAMMLGLDSFSAGLLYPLDDSEWNLQDDVQYETESELASFLYSWDNSTLAGTYWKLESVELPGLSVNIADTADEALTDTGSSMYADLRFMSLGGAVMDCRLSSSLANTADAESKYMKTASLWSDIGGKLKFEESRGIGQASIDLEYAECIRTEDTLTLILDDEGAFTFRLDYSD